MKTKTKQSDKDRRLAELAREFRAGRLTLNDYQGKAYRAILAGMKGL